MANYAPNSRAPLANFPGGPNSPEELTFPLDLPSYKYHITFDFRKFVRRSLYDRAFYAALGGVRLPIPANLVDAEAEKWGTMEAGPVIGSVMEAAMQAKAGLPAFDVNQLAAQVQDLFSSGKSMTESLSSVLGVTGDVAKSIAATIPGAATNFAIANAIQASQEITRGGSSAYLGLFGKSINPFQVVLYQCPVYKRHSFTWVLSPRNEQESTIIKNIVAKFRYHMKSDFTGGVAGGLIFDYPDMCYVTLYPKDEYLYKFKPCVVEGFQANYARQAPMGPSFYRGTGAPSEVEITVNLLEIEYWVKEDVQNSWSWSSSEPVSV